MKEFEIKIGYKPNFILILICILAFIASIIIPVVTYGTDSFALSFFFILFCVILAYKCYKQIHGHERLVLGSTAFTHSKYIKSKLKKRKEYHLLDIKNLETKKDENSEDYVSFVSIKIGGIPYSPKSTRVYSKNPTTLHFDYQGEHVKIGEGLEKFNANKFASMITEKINDKY